MHILLLENIHPVAKQELEKQGFTVDLRKGAWSEEELIAQLDNYDAVGIRSKTQVTARVLEKVNRIKSICAFCIGTNQIDLAAANACGIPVFNAPYANTRSVAELVIAEIISLSRRLSYVSMLAHQGQWLKSADNSYEVRGKNLGIIGYGHIGSQLSVLAEAMGINVFYYDIVKKLPLGNATAMASLDELLSIADFVSFHVPETPDTKAMADHRLFAKMRDGAYLINASRGSVVVIEDLVEALRSGKLRGAAVDVFPEEPKSNQEEFHSPLRGLENVILTPHIGGSTEEAQEAIGLEVAESMRRFLKEGFTGGAVNFPQIETRALPPGLHRLLHVHKNVPGVVSSVTKIVSSLGSNIISQSLNTDAEIGYMVMDFEMQQAQELYRQVAQLPTSIQTRLLSP